MSSAGSKTHELVVLADHHQFCLHDAPAYREWARGGRATVPASPAYGWTAEAVQYHRIGLEPHLIAVGKAPFPGRAEPARESAV